MTGQTLKHSWYEVFTNIVIGLCVAFPAQCLYFYMFDIEVLARHNLGLAAWMTVVSILRSFTLRRFFNNKTVKGNKNVRT